MADFASKGDVTRKVRPPLQLNNVLKIATNVKGGTKGGLRLVSKICHYYIVPNNIGFILAMTGSRSIIREQAERPKQNYNWNAVWLPAFLPAPLTCRLHRFCEGATWKEIREGRSD